MTVLTQSIWGQFNTMCLLEAPKVVFNNNFLCFEMNRFLGKVFIFNFQSSRRKRRNRIRRASLWSLCGKSLLNRDIYLNSCWWGWKVLWNVKLHIISVDFYSESRRKEMFEVLNEQKKNGIQLREKKVERKGKSLRLLRLL